MRIGILSDIHANLIALNTVLSDLRQQRLDHLVFLGDAAVFGPQPREVIATLRTINCRNVMGNTDDWLLHHEANEATDENARKLADIYYWCAEQLAPSDLEYLQSFHPTVEIAFDSAMTVLCFHGSPVSCRDVILSSTPDQELERMLSGYSATIMIGGHTHVPMLRYHGARTLINPGSVGLPILRQEDRVRHPPWANYAIVDWTEPNLHIEFRRVVLDVDKIIQTAFDSGMPHAEWWAKDWS
jgi:putative phosphoesterase